jgi:Fungal specific transcription factor domain
VSKDVPFTDYFGDKAELTNILKECIQFRMLARRQRFSETTLPPSDLPSTFPPKAACDELVQSYMRTFEPVYRIFHAPSFWLDYGSFWKEPQSIPKSFVVKLALVFALGSAFRGNQKDLSQREGLIRNWIYAAQWWLIGPSDSASLSIDGIQVGCLLILSRLTGPLSTPLWISTGSLLQMSMMMGLHRDTALFPSLTPFQVEMRNRLWVTVIELSAQSLLDSGVPLPLSLEEFDSKPPRNINDEDIFPGSKEEVQSRKDEVFTDSSIQILLRKSISARLEIARLLNDPLRKNLTFERAMQLGQEVRAACREISAFFQSHASTFQEQDRDRVEFLRKFLDIYLHRYLLFLHRPFMIEARTDPRYYLSRKICVESCLVIASHGDRLDLTNENGDDLSRLICVGSGTFKGALCMDVITILGLELVTQVEEESSTRTSSTPHPVVDPLSELAKANQTPLVRCLERIRDQLEQIIIAGRPSLKRYNFLVGVLALVRAIDFGLPIRQTICEDIFACLKKCRSYLHEHNVNKAQPGALETLPNDAAAAGDMPDPSLLFPMNGLVS